MSVLVSAVRSSSAVRVSKGSIEQVRRALPGFILLTVASLLTCCGSAPSALQEARAHPNGLEAAKYVSIKSTDLPSGYRTETEPTSASAEDASQTLAEYSCEKIDPPTDAALVTYKTPDYESAAGEVQLHETTIIFSSARAASDRLQLELNPLYPSCKSAVFKRALVASAVAGERVGFVSVKVSRLSPGTGDSGVEVVGLSNLMLPGGVAATATSELTLVVDGPIVTELSMETDGSPQLGLLNRLTQGLELRARQIAGS